MSFLDEELPKKGGDAYQIGQDLSSLSVDELAEQIELLKTEIVRLEQEIAAKKSTLDAADSVFKS